MKYPIGTRVILKSKFGSIYTLNETSSVYKRMLEKNLKYAIIIDHRNKFNTYLISKDAYLINEDGDRYSGDFFYEEDVELYVPYYRKEKLKKIEKI
jgi:hypothetical protein